MQAVPVRIPELSLSLDPAAPARPRLHSVDLVRGVVLVLLALDHVAAYFSAVRVEPADLSQISDGLFLTRWVTNLCAPTFVLLAGAGTYLALANGVPRRQQARFLAARGLGLILLELTLVRLLWTFNLDYAGQPLVLQEIAAIGVCMIALKGSTEWEDILLNLGGMLAPVVAFVATPERHLLLGAGYRAGHLCERREQHPRPVRRGRVGVVTVLVLARLDRARGQPLELPAHHRDGCLDRGPARRFRLVPVGAGQLHRQRPLRGRLRVVRRDRRSRRDQRP